MPFSLAPVLRTMLTLFAAVDSLGLQSASLPPVWTPADLHHAWRLLNYDQMRPFIARLDAGLPVTVLALGDSITSDFGGCFHRDRCVCVTACMWHACKNLRAHWLREVSDRLR